MFSDSADFRIELEIKKNNERWKTTPYLTSVFCIPLDLQVLDKTQPFYFNFTGLKHTDGYMCTTNKLRRLKPFIIVNSNSQMLRGWILDYEVKTLVPYWIQLVVLKKHYEYDVK